MDNARVKTLDQELKNLKEAVDRMYRLTSQERLNYQMIESQFEMLKARNQKLSDENVEIEKKSLQSLEAADSIVRDAKEEAQKIKAANMMLWAKNDLRFKELERFFNEGEKTKIKEYLNSIETENKEVNGGVPSQI